MRPYAALLMVVSACGFQPRAASVTPTADAAVGDDAAIIDGTPIDVMIDAPSDTDGDGVEDTIDNCPAVANADQRDHDVDGRGDACDLCPHIAESSDTDGDGDGVGDACDPRPTTAGDTRALWVGFYDANDIAGWTSSGGWAVSLGKLTGGSTSNGLSYIYPPAIYQHAFVQTAVHLNALATSSNIVNPAAQLYTGDTAPAQYYACEATLEQGGMKNAVGIAVYTGQNHVDPQPWTGTLAVGSDLTYTDVTNGGTHTCTVGQGATTVMVSQSAGGTTGVVSPAAAYANVSYDYLFVVEIGQ